VGYSNSFGTCLYPDFIKKRRPWAWRNLHIHSSSESPSQPAIMQSTFLSLLGLALVMSNVKGDITNSCPDYSIYSQSKHEPFSVGKYNLSYMRPDPACRTFNSSVVEDTIINMKTVVKDPDLYRLFENSFPNSLDTAVKWRGFAANNSREELTFLITGDINAMWLRDSANQMQSYLPLVTVNSSFDSLASLYRGVINLQARYINEAPHCNSFQPPVESGLPPTQNQVTADGFTPYVSAQTVFECKYELDSLAAFLEISTNYYEATGDIQFFRDFDWVKTINTILRTTQALLVGTYASNGSVNDVPYTWMRDTTIGTETLDNSGRGNPVQSGTGLVRSAFRPSDDA
jgi:meiotically up-regulated gene 157 (Mug157) protein